jgi:hypothetical protein
MWRRGRAMAGLTHAATASRWLRGHDAAAMLPDGPWGAELQGVAMFRVHPHGSDESQQLCSPYRPAFASTDCTHTPRPAARSNPDSSSFIYRLARLSPPHFSQYPSPPCPYAAPPLRSQSITITTTPLVFWDAPRLRCCPSSSARCSHPFQVFSIAGPIQRSRLPKRAIHTASPPATPVLRYKSPPWTLPPPTPTTWIFTDHHRR